MNHIFSHKTVGFARQFPLRHTNLMEYTVAGSTIWIFYSSYHWKKLICNLMLLILSIQLVTVFLTFSLGLNFNMQHRVVKHMYMLFYYFKSLIQ